MIDPDEVAELRQQAASDRKRARRLADHPDPSDPDHPYDENEEEDDDD